MVQIRFIKLYQLLKKMLRRRGENIKAINKIRWRDKLLNFLPLLYLTFNQ